MELLILLAIILLFFGAKRVPQVGRSLGSGLREFRKSVSEAAAGDDNKVEVQDKKKDEEELSRDGAARGEELSRTEDGEKTTRTERKP